MKLVQATHLIPKFENLPKTEQVNAIFQELQDFNANIKKIDSALLLLLHPDKLDSYLREKLTELEVGCEIILMSDEIRDNSELVKEGKLYLAPNGEYRSRFKGKLYFGSLF